MQNNTVVPARNELTKESESESKSWASGVSNEVNAIEHVEDCIKTNLATQQQ